MRPRRWMVVGLALGCRAGEATRVQPPAAHDRMARTAEKLTDFTRSELAKQFVVSARSLPVIALRTVYRDAEKKHAFTEGEARALPESERRSLTAVPIDDEAYYTPPQYGDVFAYARAFDVWAEASGREHATWSGMRVFDFGYGGVGHLRMLASLGVDAVGVDPDPVLRAMYAAPTDQGAIGAGSVRLVSGRFAADPGITEAIGTGYDLVISKNVLKRGYIHPTRRAPEKWLIALGVDDDTFLGAIRHALAPGGWFVIYNICPAEAPEGQPFKPWSDGHSPFSEAQLRAAGFDVMAFDRDDTAAVRQMGRILGWDVGDEKVDLEHDLFATYTLVHLPVR